MKVIYVDIDETICRREKSTDFGVVHDYKKAKPIKENIEKVSKNIDVPNDFSSSAFFIVSALINSNSKLVLKNINNNC